MQKFQKNLLKICIGVIGITVGITFVLILASLSLKNRIIVSSCLVAVAIIVFVCVAVVSKKQNTVINDLLSILYKDLNPDKFIDESLKTLETVKSRALKKTLLLNLAVGYQAKCMFDKAIETTKSINIKGASTVFKAMYHCNLAMFYAQSGDIDNALLTFAEGEKNITASEAKLPEANLLLVKGIVAFVDGEMKKSQRCLKSAKEAGFDEKHSSYYADIYLGKIYKQEGKLREAKEVFARISRKKTLPYITAAALHELDSL